MDAKKTCFVVMAKRWVLATLAEAYRGLGDAAKAQPHLAEANVLDVPMWMKETTTDQLARLEALLASSPLHYIKKTS